MVTHEVRVRAVIDMSTYVFRVRAVIACLYITHEARVRAVNSVRVRVITTIWNMHQGPT